MTRKLSFKEAEERLYKKHKDKISLLNYDIPDKAIFKCNICNHGWVTKSYSVFSGNGCPNCANLIRRNNYQLPLEKIKDYIESNNCKLLSDKYINQKSKLLILFECGHPYKISFECFKRGHRCPCKTKSRKGHLSPNWKGGTGKLRHSFDGIIIQWKKDSAKSCNYKCVITGDRFNDIHHLYSMKSIIKETLDSLGLTYKSSIGDYSEVEIIKIIDELAITHKKYPLGVCLRKDVHKLFHKIYGNKNFTPKDFYQFKEDYSSLKLKYNQK